MTIYDWQKALLALLIWREAEGEPMEGKLGVAWVVRNRVLDSPLPNAWTAVMTRRLQFSGLTAHGDPRLQVWPRDSQLAWKASMQAAEQVYTASTAAPAATPDPTHGATLYANLSIVTPSWLPRVTETAKIGSHTFFKE